MQEITKLNEKEIGRSTWEYNEMGVPIIENVTYFVVVEYCLLKAYNFYHMQKLLQK